MCLSWLFKKKKKEEPKELGVDFIEFYQAVYKTNFANSQLYIRAIQLTRDLKEDETAVITIHKYTLDEGDFVETESHSWEFTGPFDNGYLTLTKNPNIPYQTKQWLMVQPFTHACFLINIKIRDKEFNIELGDIHSSDSGVLVSKYENGQKTKNYYKIDIKDIKFGEYSFNEAPFTCNLIPHDNVSTTAVRYNPTTNIWTYKD